MCGSSTDLAGFGYVDDAESRVGFNIELCRAVAAAVLGGGDGDGDAVEIVATTAGDRGTRLRSGEVDMLFQNVTWTTTRDAQWGDFTVIMFYDGRGLWPGATGASAVPAT